MTPATAPVLALSSIVHRFAVRATAGAGRGRRTMTAVAGVDLQLSSGEVLGLVGESGCGKTTLGRIAAGLLAPTQGTVVLPARTARVPGVQMIFQNPRGSLNPRRRIGEQIAEAPLVHGLVARAGAGALVDGLLRQVGLDGTHARAFPHQLSGGQAQRAALARALAVRPAALVLDEPVSALDAATQAGVLALLARLKEELGLAGLFISHDLGAVERLAGRIAVMYLGRIVEEASAAAFFAGPRHPYARALLEARPSLSRRGQAFRPVAGELPSPLAPPTGCAFHPRCPIAVARCAAEVPALRQVAPGRRSACHLDGEGQPGGRAPIASVASSARGV